MSSTNTIQVLIATIDQMDRSLLEKMNIQTDAIVGNQLINETVTFDTDIFCQNYKGHTVKWLNFKEKGVGLNRNNALMRATADILIFADDDMVFKKDYASTVREKFVDHPTADVIVFNLDEETPSKRYKNKKESFTKKIGYGAARIACRRDVITKRGIFFNLCFGGGTPYACGEDTMFLSECVRHKLKILAVPESIAILKDSESSWFKGYTEQFFYDKGFLMANTGVSFLVLRILKSSYNYSKQCKTMNLYTIINNQLCGAKDMKRKTWKK